MRISDWSSDVCSSDLQQVLPLGFLLDDDLRQHGARDVIAALGVEDHEFDVALNHLTEVVERHVTAGRRVVEPAVRIFRSEEHTSELQSLMRISYAVFCLKKKTQNRTETITSNYT